MRLKSRTVFPPGGGVHLLLPELGMTHDFIGSFREVVNYYLSLAAKNKPQFQKLGWPMDQIGAENFVEQRECRRLISQGWTSFVDMSTPPTGGGPMPVPLKKNILGRVVEAGRASKSGIKYWVEQFGPDGKPVGKELSERRAAVCATCPQNDLERRLEDYFIGPVANGFKFVYEMMRDIKLETSVDAKLGVCRACSCPLKSKVHGKLDHILGIMSESTLSGLPEHCWIKKKDQ